MRKFEKDVDWDLVPTGYSVGFAVADLPLWLKIAVQLPPMRWHQIHSIQKRGYARYTPSRDVEKNDMYEAIDFNDQGWRDPRTGKSVLEMIVEGSIAPLKFKRGN